MAGLRFRIADPSEYPRLRDLIIDSFEPITWFKKLDQLYGPLNGSDWRRRWEKRLAVVFRTETIMVGEVEGEIVAAATGTYDEDAALGFIDLLAVDKRSKGLGHGRAMLRGMLDHFRRLGGKYANLDCLADNVAGNGLYQSEGWRIVASSNRYFIELGERE